MLKHKHRTEDEHIDEPSSGDITLRDEQPRDRSTVADEPTLVDRSPDPVIEDDPLVRRAPEPVVVERDVEPDIALPPPPHETGVRIEQITTETRFWPGQVLIVLAGAAALALGVATMIEGGLGGSLTAPVVEVFEWDHTPLLGVVEAGAGVLLLLAGLHPSGRVVAGLVGALMVAAGVVVLAEVDWVQEQFATEQRYGWVPIVIGGVALVGAFGLPTRTSRRVTVVR